MRNKRRIPILIASDHAGFALKQWVQTHLGHIAWCDLGTSTADRCDYPDFAQKLGQKLGSRYPLGILICGSGIGMSIAANKIPGVRAAVVESIETARLAKQHNNANVLCLGARILTRSYAKRIIQAWLDAKFEGGRHAGRVRKIAKLEREKE